MASDTLDLLQQRRNRVLNTIHTWLLGAGSLLLLGATAWALAGGTGIVYAIVFGAFTMWLARRVSPQVVLKMYKARPVGRANFPAGVEIVETLAQRAGLPSAPKLYVVPSKMMNAFAVGRRDDSAIAITDGLARLTGRELAGVLAHEISHIAHEDLRVMAFADMVSRFTSLWSTFGIFGALFNLFSLAGGAAVAPVPWPAVLLLVLAPTVGGLLQLALSRTREFDADLGAVMLTGDPDGLASALAKLEKAQGLYWESLMLPGSRQPAPSVLRTHPRTEDRVALLMALKSQISAEPEFGDEPAMPTPRRRPSLVPGIRLPKGFDRAAFMPMAAVELPELTADRPLCDGPLAQAENSPRIRPLRGGVYW